MNSSSNISSAIINTVATVFSFEPALSRGGRKNLSTAGAPDLRVIEADMVARTDPLHAFSGRF